MFTVDDYVEGVTYKAESWDEAVEIVVTLLPKYDPDGSKRKEAWSMRFKPHTGYVIDDQDGRILIDYFKD